MEEHLIGLSPDVSAALVDPGCPLQTCATMNDDTNDLLREIRELQRQHLEEYRKVADRSLALQETAVARQEQIASLYRRVVAVVASLLAVAGIAYLVSTYGG